MSQANVELSRRFWTLFNDRDWDAWWSLLDENVEWHARTDKPDVDIYRGHKSLRSFVDAWTEMFPDIRVELAGESIDLGEQVVTPTLIVGTARTTGIEVRDPYSFLFKIAEGKIVLGQEFHDNAEALKAVGMSE
jgi:ketosteroid isomerase-like protein